MTTTELNALLREIQHNISKKFSINIVFVELDEGENQHIIKM